MIDTITGATRQDQPCDTGWHVYRMAWSTDPESLVFSKDGIVYLTTLPQAGTEWCYSDGNPFYTLLNLAVGGNGGGPVPAGFSSAEMLVDYVRVW
jgi:beta-glucanase (GH16 family)